MVMCAGIFGNVIPRGSRGRTGELLSDSVEARILRVSVGSTGPEIVRRCRFGRFWRVMRRPLTCTWLSCAAIWFDIETLLVMLMSVWMLSSIEGIVLPEPPLCPLTALMAGLGGILRRCGTARLVVGLAAVRFPWWRRARFSRSNGLPRLGTLPRRMRSSTERCWTRRIPSAGDARATPSRRWTRRTTPACAGVGVGRAACAPALSATSDQSPRVGGLSVA